MGDHREQFEKNNHHFSEKKRSITFFKFFPLVPPMEFLFILWYPKGSMKNWPKCHSSQSVSSQSDTGQTVSPAKLSLAKVSLAKRSLWPKCHSGQSVPAKVSLAKVSFWPNCDSADKAKHCWIMSTN